MAKFITTGVFNCVLRIFHPLYTAQLGIVCLIRPAGKNIKNLKKSILTFVKQIVCVIIVYMKDIEKQLKQVMIDSGMTRAEIVRKSKNQLSEAQLSYFVNGKRSLTLPAAAKLAKVLGLELKSTQKEVKK